MPKFPTYQGELPECLNPLNARHYLLLLYWIFFRPTALKCYLYQADPDLYKTEMGSNIFRVKQVAAYRNPFIMMPVLGGILSVLLALPFMMLFQRIEQIPVNWPFWAIGLAGGMFVGMLGSIIFGMLMMMTSHIAAAVSFGLVAGFAGGMVTSIWVSATAGVIMHVLPNIKINSSAISFGIVIGILCSLAIGPILGARYKKMPKQIIVGISTGIPTGIITGVLVALIIAIGSSMGTVVTFGIAFNLMGGVTAGMLMGLSFSILFSTVSCFGYGIVGGVGFSVIAWLIFDAITAAIFLLGLLRLILYPFQILCALCYTIDKKWHPVHWDELTILPLPWTRKILAQHLEEDEDAGLYLLVNVGRNPFRRAAIQTVLYQYLHNKKKHESRLHFLYQLLSHPDLQEYVSMPMGEKDWSGNIPGARLLLGELALKFVGTTWIPNSRISEGILYRISYPFRERKQTPLTKFAGMIVDLLDKDIVDIETFTLRSYCDTYNTLSQYPCGDELAGSFEAMATFLSYSDISQLSKIAEILTGLTSDNPDKPSALTALGRLKERLKSVGAEIATYQDSTSRANQLAALARANSALKEVDDYILAEVIAPEQNLLRRIIRQWQTLITAKSGEVGRAEIIGPVANPYVAGNPVTGDLFVGRADSLRRLEELWSGTRQKPSVVLYGHRRMGKSSILHNLGARFGKDALVVDFNMQRVMVESTGELLHSLALAIYDKLPIEKRRMLQEPDEERFLTRNPYKVFDDRFLKEVDRLRGELWFIITIDEFELIEARIEEGILEARLLEFWRGLIQTYPWFVMAFAGLHTLREMTQDYWNPLFGSVTGIPISFLKAGAARTLITQPSRDFDIDYDVEAIERIIGLTHGQPYLIQLICHCLVTHFNRQTFEEGIERERRFSLADVEAVIDTPEFYRDGDAYFTGVWKQAETSDAPRQQDVLQALAQTETGMLLEELIQQIDRTREAVQQALEVLERHDVITEHEGRWQFTVELMRRWVIQNLK